MIIKFLQYVLGFILIAVSANQVAYVLRKYKLPIITGLLITGILAGPYVLELLPLESTASLRFVNDLSLAFIAFAAGSELYLKELRSRIQSILWNTFGQLVVTFVTTSIMVYFTLDYLSFFQELSHFNKLAISILSGTIFVARSPSSAIAIINELRAKGPFTQTALGVTVVKDVLVIILFTICFALAQNLTHGDKFQYFTLLLLVVEIAVSILLGWLLNKLLALALSLRLSYNWKIVLMLALGFGSYEFSYFVKDFTHGNLSFEIYLEPLLICITASLLVANTPKHRVEFLTLIEKSSSVIYIIFFTYIGISMSIDTLQKVWLVALGFFLIRLVGLILGAYVGGTLAKDPADFRRLGWMPYVTQAGVAIGLTARITSEFTVWGDELSTVLISVVVINQIVGPPVFKFSLEKIGEARLPADSQEFDGIRDALIFGLESQSIALAKQLQENGWQVVIVTKKPNVTEEEAKGQNVRYISDISIESLESLDIYKVDAIVCMLTDYENYKICELAHDEIGIKDLIVRLNDRANMERFLKLKAKIVDPSTAIVSLLDHFVRSPLATSILLGMEKGQDSMDVEVQNSDLHGLALRDLRLPTEVIILSIRRGGQMLISHGYTRLRLGDIITLVGSKESLEEVSLKFE